MTGIGFDLLAQAPDVDVNGSRRHKRSFFPDRVKKLIASEDTATMRGKVLEEAEFANRGEDVASRDLHRHGGYVDFQITQPENFSSCGTMTQSSQHGADASHQFARAEGLGDVVIAAKFKTLH